MRVFSNCFASSLYCTLLLYHHIQFHHLGDLFYEWEGQLKQYFSSSSASGIAVQFRFCLPTEPEDNFIDDKQYCTTPGIEPMGKRQRACVMT